MKKEITDIIKNNIEEFSKRNKIKNIWGDPITAFADANDKEFFMLPEIVGTAHVTPFDVMKDAKTVICYFVPFKKGVADGNRSGEMASESWARAYEDTNSMFLFINKALEDFFEEKRYRAKVCAEATEFDRIKIKSKWSVRHVARIAGLGSFGVNNMLITKKGCCGRLSSIITNMAFTPTEKLTEEYCIYKKSGKCLACVKKCPSGALAKDGFDRQKCFETCKKNAAIYNYLGNSYGGESENSGSEVCGKCVCGMPCAYL